MSSELIEKAAQILEDHKLSKTGISKFALSNFVIGKELTLQGKQWQCIREIDARLASIKSMQLQIQESKDNIELINIKRIKLGFNYKRAFESIDCPDERMMLEKELDIKTRKYERQIQSMTEAKEEVEALLEITTEELNFITQMFEHLLTRGEWKDFDDPKAQGEYWNSKLSYEVGMRMSLGKPLDIELARTIDALPHNLPVKGDFLKLVGAMKQIEKKEKDGEK